jgi:hypothetical protein
MMEDIFWTNDYRNWQDTNGAAAYPAEELPAFLTQGWTGPYPNSVIYDLVGAVISDPSFGDFVEEHTFGSIFAYSQWELQSFFMNEPTAVGTARVGSCSSIIGRPTSRPTSF